MKRTFSPLWSTIVRWSLPGLAVVCGGMAGCTQRMPGRSPSAPRKIKMTEMTVLSNQENTEFRLQLEGKSTWTRLGKAKILKVQVPKNHPFTIAAHPDGYRERRHTMVEPLRNAPLRFTFEISDREQAARPRPPINARPQPPRQRDHEPLGVIRKRWAVVIGISDYQDHRIPALRYAARDAEAFHEWLTSNDGGRYSPANTKLLLDDQATSQNIREALFTWLKQAIEEDLVTIYFSGHGTPESPDQPDNLFLVSYDTNYDRIAATAFPMWDVQTALQRFIEARRVVVIADACHAGGVGSEFAVARRAIGANDADAADKINQGLHDLSNVGSGVVVLTSARSSQLSREGREWGGGHGVFTHFLLEGLRGSADNNADQRITLGELTSYLSEQVRRATKNAQCPEVAGRYDPALTIGR